MEPSSGDDTSTHSATRRAVLAAGAGVTSAALGLAGVPERATAWDRFDVDFKGSTEVWFVAGDDLDYDPPTVVHAIVAAGLEAECVPVEFTPEAATTVPAQYGDAPVVKFSVPRWQKIVGVLPYSRGGGGRFARPWCVIENDESDGRYFWIDVEDADCVEAAVDGPWDGEVRSCWFDPTDGEESWL